MDGDGSLEGYLICLGIGFLIFFIALGIGIWRCCYYMKRRNNAPDNGIPAIRGDYRGEDPRQCSGQPDMELLRRPRPTILRLQQIPHHHHLRLLNLPLLHPSRDPRSRTNMTSKQEAILNSSVPKSTPYETGWGQPLKGENKEKADDAVRCKYVLFDTLHKL